MLKPDQAMLACQQIVDMILASRVIKQNPAQSNDWITWVNILSDDQRNRRQYRPLPLNLYDGIMGIAMFLACYTGPDDEHDLAGLIDNIVSPAMTCSLAHSTIQSDTSIGLTGYGGIIYGLAYLYKLLGEPLYQRYALNFIQATREQALMSTEYDLMYGQAGYLLALITYYRITGTSLPLENIVEAGMKLLDHPILRTLRQETCHLQRPVPTGYAHGASGLLHCLIELWHISQKQIFLDSVRSLQRYEDQYWQPETGNWIDLRQTDPIARTSTPSMNAWCTGACGIGLARLTALQYGIMKDICLRDTRRATRSLSNGQLASRDTLCCGNAGRILFLINASNILGKEIYYQMAMQLAANMLERARKNRGYQYGMTHTINVPYSLFRGIAGIGYAFLRVARPQTSPDIFGQH